MSVHLVSNDFLSIDLIEEIFDKKYTLALSSLSEEQIRSCHQFLTARIADGITPYYGVNTGFGALCNVVISPEHLARLQQNLILSHACGTGNPIPSSIVRMMILLKVQSLAYGHSGVSLETVQRLMYFFNEGICPVVYEYGSLGASGDLAPLAHLFLPFIGYGEVEYEGKIISTTELYQKIPFAPAVPGPKEGLALLNGTEFMTAFGVQIILELRKILKWADVIAALSLDGFDGRIEPFHPLLHHIRPHAGQIETAERILKFLADSPIANRTTNKSVQDPYSFRCVPQVHGSVKSLVYNAAETVQTEINSVSDNPNIFAVEEMILSGGNFHGQEMATALDSLAVGMAHLAGISERRTYLLQSGKRGLPPFLTPEPGLQSGLMILQYTAAALINEIRHLAAPHSLGSVPSCDGQEDFVSMGANAALKSYKMLGLVRKVLAVELIHASQALYFRLPETTSPYLNDLINDFREQVPVVTEDRPLYIDLKKAEQFLTDYSLA